MGHSKRAHCKLASFFTHAFPEPIAFTIHGQDVGMMGQPVQQGPGQLFAAEHLWPLGEVQISGHDERLALVTLGHYLEEELGSFLREWHIADLVDDQQVHLG